jgi:hypothetical protein
MTIVLGVLLGLLSTLGAVAHAMTTSRQRTIAVSLAKQTIENIEGADWANVATGTGVTTADPLVTPGTPLKFGGEDLFFGGTSPYRTYPVAAGATFALTTFVTTVPPAGGEGTGYRHVTVIIAWPSTNPAHTMQFSSLVFPLDYTSYPAGNGTAEVTDGLVTLSGCLGGDTFDDVHVALPGARADTIASTLRTAIGSATSAAAHVEVHPRLDSATCVPVDPVVADQCPRVNITNVADNDSSTSTPNTASGSGGSFLCPISPTAGGLAVVVPPAVPTSLSSDAKTDACSPTCAFAGATDTVPFADAAVTPTAGSSATFNSGGLSGSLWSFASGWSATTRVDHDTITSTSGSVTTSASLSAPALTILSLPGVPDGVVKVDSFTATASASAGYTTTAPNLVFATTLQIWNGSGYDAVVVAPGTSWSGTPTLAVGDRQVSLLVTVQTQPLLLVSVAVTITPSTLDAVPGLGTDNFTIEVNYGRVAANSAWLSKAA